MNLIYIANIRLPTERAHGWQIMKMCEALNEGVARLVLVVPKRLNQIKSDPFTYYQLGQSFEIKRLLCLDLVRFGRWGFFIQSLSFTLSVVVRFLFSSSVVFFTRDEIVAFFLCLLGKKVCWEGHQGHSNFFVRYLIKKKIKLVFISKGLADFYSSQGLSSSDYLIAPDGVDLKDFNFSSSRRELRKKLGLPVDKKIVLYTGHLYDWKGARTLAEACPRLLAGIEVVLIGGTKEEVANFLTDYKNLSNLRILGHQKHQEIPSYLKSADLLILPNSGKEKISRLYTSPLKLFEYMASGTPIIASDLPSLREVLNEKNSLLIESDDSRKLAEAVNELIENKEKANLLAIQAREDVNLFTWEKRAGSIINYLGKVE